MSDYRKMYFQLAAKVADAIDILVEAQQQGEDEFIEEDAPLIKLKNTEPEQNDEH